MRNISYFTSNLSYPKLPNLPKEFNFVSSFNRKIILAIIFKLLFNFHKGSIQFLSLFLLFLFCFTFIVTFVITPIYIFHKSLFAFILWFFQWLRYAMFTNFVPKGIFIYEQSSGKIFMFILRLFMRIFS